MFIQARNIGLCAKVLPLIVGYVLQRGLWKGGEKLKFRWHGDVFESID